MRGGEGERRKGARRGIIERQRVRKATKQKREGRGEREGKRKTKSGLAFTDAISSPSRDATANLPGADDIARAAEPPASLKSSSKFWRHAERRRHPRRALELFDWRHADLSASRCDLSSPRLGFHLRAIVATIQVASLQRWLTLDLCLKTVGFSSPGDRRYHSSSKSSAVVDS